MNRNCYRLVFNATAMMMVPKAETARRRGKSVASESLAGVALALSLVVTQVKAELPVVRPGVGTAGFVSYGQAGYQVNGNQAFINQVGNTSILNWKSFNLSPGTNVQFRQVDSLATNNLIPGASFTSLNRIWDTNPSVISGSITQGASQKANVILVNTNGIAFMNGAQVNLNSFTASSLDIKDAFITESLFPGDKLPQFAGTGGFVKVFEGAEITAGNFGRVMLLAPTVVNKGKVSAPDGQVIVAAAEKVYLAPSADASLRGVLVEIDSSSTLDNFSTANTNVKNGILDGAPVALTEATQDLLGHATNAGVLNAARGNVTVMGYAVNQMGMARATTAVGANGSIYLQAKDRAISPTSGALKAEGSTRAGRVTLGAGSLTAVAPETTDQTSIADVQNVTTKVFNSGLELQSQVSVLGQEIRMASGATIDAPSGTVSMLALEAPGTLSGTGNPLSNGLNQTSDKARIHIEQGARINVAGLENVEVSVSRNTLEVELRGDELKDSPVNRLGALRGQKAYVDVKRAQGTTNSLIAADSLEAYQGRFERTVSERSTAAGKVSLYSQGEAIVESGASFDLSGGSVLYTPGLVKTTLLSQGNKLTDLADAVSTTRYDGIATRYVIDYGTRWASETLDLGQSYRFDAGYVEGKNAGTLNIFGMAGTYFQADVLGRTTVGTVQRASALQPLGARVTFGFDDSAGSNSRAGDVATRDYKLNQNVDLTDSIAWLPDGFKFGDALTEDLKKTLSINSRLLGKGKVASLDVFTNQTVAVRSALRTPQSGGISLTGTGIAVNADIVTPSGAINLAAKNSVMTVPEPLVGVLPSPTIKVADGVSLLARGAWVNEMKGVPAGTDDLALIKGGKITLAAESQASSGVLVSTGLIELGKATLLDASGGASIRPDAKLANGKTSFGNGGEVSLDAYAVRGLDQNLRAYGTGKGGTVTLTSNNITVGGQVKPDVGGVLLDPLFFQQGGFANFNVSAFNQFTVSAGTVIAPAVMSSELMDSARLAPSGANFSAITQIAKREDRLREAANVSFAVKPKELGKGGLLVDTGAKIVADAKAAVSFEARNQIKILGSVSAPGGTITAKLIGTDGLVSQNSIWLGGGSVLDVSGKAVTYTNSNGQVMGEVLGGGAVNLEAKTGYVITQAGSQINVSGAAPVKLDVLNEAGGIGRMVGSDAGTVTLLAEEGLLLDGAMKAAGGGATNRGGTFNLTLSKYDVNVHTLAPSPITLSLAQTAVPQAQGLTFESVIPSTGVVRSRVGVSGMEEAGFDRMLLASRDAILLEDGLNLGANRALPLREVKLDAARIQSGGGQSSISAETVKVGNYDVARPTIGTLSAGSGNVSISGRQLELAGRLRFDGMASAALTGTDSILLAGVTNNTSRPKGELNASADLTFNGGVIAPTTYTEFGILAPQNRVTFARNTDSPAQPLSALGSLLVEARDVVQDGNVWAPFGQLDFRATESIVFKNGSLTSVAANSDSLIPFGKVLNGRSWVYEVDATTPVVPVAGQLAQSDLSGKSIRVAGKAVNMATGAKVNLSGGGDLQAYEFTVGPGGSKNILADSNLFAIIPGYTSGISPGDQQELRGFGRSVGDSVYLSGVAGLAEGVYTLLPAHYALMPGAYAVDLSSSNTVKGFMPGQAYTRQDGIRVAAGYMTDSRIGAPKDSTWSGFQVLTREQVLARSELTLSRASSFFSDSKFRPQDAGLLSIRTTGTGSDSLKLDGTFKLSTGVGGSGGSVDISAAALAITSGSPAGLDPNMTQVTVEKLNSMGAASLLVGGTRSTAGGNSVLTIGANTVVLANDAGHSLQVPEVLLAAKDTLTLKSGSLIEARGPSASTSNISTAGDGALLRAASSSATYTRTGSPGAVTGTLVGEVGSRVVASNAVTLDATKTNAFKGVVEFQNEGKPVAGNLSVGAPRINFGAAPLGALGLTYGQDDLNALTNLASMTLISYSGFDLYGGVQVGQLDLSGKPTLKNLTLQGAGLAGITNSGQSASLIANVLTLSNPANSAFTSGGVLGDGVLQIQADTLNLGAGTKSIQGFSQVNIVGNELVGQGKGSIGIEAASALNVARISGALGADQVLTSSGLLTLDSHVANRALASVTALGSKFAFTGASVVFNTQAVLPSGILKVEATSGDVNVASKAQVDVAGRVVPFFDTTQNSWAGSVELTSALGNVTIESGANVNESPVLIGDGGKLLINAISGSTDIANGSVMGVGANAIVDVGSLASFTTLNNALNSGGFGDTRSLRVRTGDLTVGGADSVQAKTISIAVDAGQLSVAGQLQAKGDSSSRLELSARNNVTVLAGAKLEAKTTGVGKQGGDIELGTQVGRISLANLSSVNVAGGAGGEGGTVLLRAPRVSGDLDVNVDPLAGSLASTAARSFAIEAVKVYSGSNINLSATGATSATQVSLATVKTDYTNFVNNQGAAKTRLGQSDVTLLAGTEVRSTGNITLGADWNLDMGTLTRSVPGALTLRAGGSLNINNNLSDGFSTATPCTTAICAATPSPSLLRAFDSWSYRLIAGADSNAANTMAVKPGTVDVTLAAGKLVRSGTGDIRIASGRNIVLGDNKSAIYTAGKVADLVPGFVTPISLLRPVFSSKGGDITMTALGDISGKPSAQLYSEWLYRQGALDPTTNAYTKQPAWWSRFDQFQQGVGVLGGGDATLIAGGTVKDVSVSIPTQGRMVALTPDEAKADSSKLVVLGGGDMRVDAGADVLGGQYFTGRGVLSIQANGKVGASDQKINTNAQPLETLIALGDGQANVRARDSVSVSNLLSPQLVVQSAGNLVTGIGATTPLRSMFSTYSADSGVSLQSLLGGVTLTEGVGLNTAFPNLAATEGRRDNQFDAAYWLPASLAITAFQSSIALGTNARNLTLSPSAKSNLALLAADSVDLKAVISMSDRDSTFVPSPVRPVSVDPSSTQGLLLIPKLAVNLDIPSALDHGAVPVHLGDSNTAKVYASGGDIRGTYLSANESLVSSLNISKATQLKAGRDIRDVGVLIQQSSTTDVSQIEAGRDVLFSGVARRDGAKVWVSGPGRLEVTAGRNVDLGTSAGIVSRGNLDNQNLPDSGASLHLAAGVGAKGIDYAGAVDRLIIELGKSEGSSTDPGSAALWQARWLVGDDNLLQSQAIQAVKALKTLDAESLKTKVRQMVFKALQTTGRDSNSSNSGFKGDFTRGYAALDTLFPERNVDGSANTYQGKIDLFASRVKTEKGGDIEFLLPGGDLVVGLSNTPANLVNVGSKVLGIVAAGKGDIKGFARDNILVNQSRILTASGGDVLLWSSTGNIDAGKGKKTASALPPPLTIVDKNGNVTQVLQGAVNGSGIGALTSVGVEAGDVDLIAPKGTVDAGDAGIRAGNLNIAAQVVLGADNISVSGTSVGTPVADTSAVTATASGAAASGDDSSKSTSALSQNATNAAQSAQALKDAFKPPSIVRVDVLGFGQ